MKRTSLKIFSKLRLAQTHAKENIYWCVGENAQFEKIDASPQILKIKMDGNIFNIDHLMSELWNTGIRSLYVEGGASTFAALIQSGWAHRLYIYQAPHIIGAGGGLSWTQALSISKMDQRHGLKNLRISQWGDDWLLTARFLD